MLILVLVIMLLCLFLGVHTQTERTQIQKRRGSRMPMAPPRNGDHEVDAMDVDATDEVGGYGTQIKTAAI